MVETAVFGVFRKGVRKEYLLDTSLGLATAFFDLVRDAGLEETNVETACCSEWTRFIPDTVRERVVRGGVSFSWSGWRIDRDLVSLSSGDELPCIVVVPTIDVTEIDIINHDVLGRIGEHFSEHLEAFAA